MTNPNNHCPKNQTQTFSSKLVDNHHPYASIASGSQNNFRNEISVDGDSISDLFNILSVLKKIRQQKNSERFRNYFPCPPSCVLVCEQAVHTVQGHYYAVKQLLERISPILHFGCYFGEKTHFFLSILEKFVLYLWFHVNCRLL